jgi:hypothetical protein
MAASGPAAPVIGAIRALEAGRGARFERVETLWADARQKR